MNNLSILKLYSEDLKNIDLSLLDSDLKSIDSIEIYKNRLDMLAQTCAYKNLYHPEWALLAGRLKLLALKTNCGNFSDTTEKARVILNDTYYNFVMENKDKLNNMIVENRDLTLDWFGICTSIRSYLLKINKETIET